MIGHFVSCFTSGGEGGVLTAARQTWDFTLFFFAKFHELCRDADPRADVVSDLIHDSYVIENTRSPAHVVLERADIFPVELLDKDFNIDIALKMRFVGLLAAVVAYNGIPVDGVAVAYERLPNYLLFKGERHVTPKTIEAIPKMSYYFKAKGRTKSQIYALHDVFVKAQTSKSTEC